MAGWALDLQELLACPLSTCRRQRPRHANHTVCTLEKRGQRILLKERSSPYHYGKKNGGSELVDVLLGDSFLLKSCSCKWQWRDGHWMYKNFWHVHCPPAVVKDHGTPITLFVRCLRKWCLSFGCARLSHCGSCCGPPTAFPSLAGIGVPCVSLPGPTDVP